MHKKSADCTKCRRGERSGYRDKVRAVTAKAGWGVMAALVSAGLGYILSLTTGKHPEVWPWLIAGAVFVIAVGLILVEPIAMRRDKRRGVRAVSTTPPPDPKKPERIGIRARGRSKTSAPRAEFGKTLDVAVDSDDDAVVDAPDSKFE